MDALLNRSSAKPSLLSRLRKSFSRLRGRTGSYTLPSTPQIVIPDFQKLLYEQYQNQKYTLYNTASQTYNIGKTSSSEKFTTKSLDSTITKDDLQYNEFIDAAIKDFIKSQHERINFNSYDNSKEVLDKSDSFYKVNNLHKLKKWYETKNPTYQKISNLAEGITLKECLPLVAVMAKDFLLAKTNIIADSKSASNLELQNNKTRNNRNNNRNKNTKNTLTNNRFNKTKKVLKNNKANNSYKHPTYGLYNNPAKKQSILINKINMLLALVLKFSEEYKYNIFLILVREYLSLFSYGSTSITFGNEHNKTRPLIDPQYLNMHFDGFYNSTFILYPSLRQISYDKVIFTMQAPIVNFGLRNKSELIHRSSTLPSGEMLHDIIHAELTHNPNTTNTTHTYLSEEIQKRFTINKKTIDSIKDKINYSQVKDKKSIDYYTKKLFAYYIFVLVHEIGRFAALGNLNEFLKGETVEMLIFGYSSTFMEPIDISLLINTLRLHEYYKYLKNVNIYNNYLKLLAENNTTKLKEFESNYEIESTAITNTNTKTNTTSNKIREYLEKLALIDIFNKVIADSSITR